MMASLEVSALGTREVQLSVLLALEEVTRHQRTLRDVLDRLERRKNREEVSHLLESDVEEEEEEGEGEGQEGEQKIFLSQHR